jgi:hypothetical protein
MYMEPGVMEAAKHSGVKHMALKIAVDPNMDGKINGADINVARANHQDLALGVDAKASKAMAQSNVVRTPMSC